MPAIDAAYQNRALLLVWSSEVLPKLRGELPPAVSRQQSQSTLRFAKRRGTIATRLHSQNTGQRLHMNLKSIHVVRCGALLLLLSVLGACQSAATRSPIPTVPTVDLPRFMGDWYVLGNIPTFIEKEAFNAVESYRLAADGTIETTFTFNKGASDGPPKQYTPKGFVRDTTSNAVWGMQFVWPVKAEYLIAYLNDDYSQTIIARNRRDYVWILARTPTLPEKEFDALIERTRQMGYDVTLLRRVPQRNGK
jgi:apolipoprotein D and lipocalin family protein